MKISPKFMQIDADINLPIHRKSYYVFHFSLVFQWYSHSPSLIGGVIKKDWYISAGAVKR